MKLLYCRDAGFDCAVVIEGDSADEILDRARRHATAHHGIDFTPELETRVSELIRTVGPAD